jgi:hypothetical protein
MKGEIHALFYRYRSRGGFDYVADLFIGPRTAPNNQQATELATRPGDSGTLWLLDPADDNAADEPADGTDALPLAIQWGSDQLLGTGIAQAYVLATFMSRACDLLGVDVVRDWNLDQPDTWGSVGHYSIAARASNAINGARAPRLKALMTNNLTIISHDDNTIETDDFKGQGTATFVPMADVPDFYWKPGVAKQGHTRPGEGPNHFADMDQPRPGDNKTLLDLCATPANIDPASWNDFYDTVSDILTGDPIMLVHRGLLPFRVWQIFDELVRYAAAAKRAEFVCAAGVLAHYVGDACQPLHISYLHDGDPHQPVTKTVHHKDGTTSTKTEALGTGVHSAYESVMVNNHRVDILHALASIKPYAKSKLVKDGKAAARATIELMRTTFTDLPPSDIVNASIAFEGTASDRADMLWEKFGDKTITAMSNGARLLGALWESAWTAGQGETKIKSDTKITQTAAIALIDNPNFLPSKTIDQIAAILR